MPVIPGSGSNLAKYGNFVGDVFGLSDVYEKQVENKEQNNKFASWPESAIYGYYAGGLFSTATFYSTIDRLDFSTENRTTPTPKLSTGRFSLSATSGSSYGYFGGGQRPPAVYVSTIDRLDFSSETVTTPTPKLSLSRIDHSATSSSSYGYFGGGQGAAELSSVDRLDLSSETATIIGNLSQSKVSPGGLSGGQSV